MISVTTFTIQSVHGLKETFVVDPNGTVDTTKSYTNRDGDPSRREPAGEQNDRKAAK